MELGTPYQGYSTQDAKMRTTPHQGHHYPVTKEPEWPHQAIKPDAKEAGTLHQGSRSQDIKETS